VSQALYRKYRSRTLDEVLGQDHITNILKRALERQKIAHAYLLTGPRGTGKTSVARILAHEVNKLPYEDDTTHLDIIEIDAASNNGVDDIRSLREKAQVAPTSAKYKVYIIDEVHMLSKPAFNALLKTLEEPPKHVIFILATTDADKLPKTILSRVQQYHFHPIGQKIITEHLKSIAEKEGFLIEQEAAELIARHAKGGFRDSISLLDQLSSLASKDEALTKQQVADSLGLGSAEYISDLLEAYDHSDTATICQTLDLLEEQGSGPAVIAQQLLATLRDQLVDQPSYAALIKKLIGVSRSPYPDLELLTALLSDEDTTSAKPVTKSIEQKKKSTAKKSTIKSESPNQEAKTTTAEPAITDDKPEKSTAKKTVSKIENWDQDKFLEAAKEQSVGLYSLLAKCDCDFSDSTLTIYAGKTFTKKKLDDDKNRPLINLAVSKSHGSEAEIVIKNGQQPLEDDKLAAVAEIMGGGKVVKLEELS